MKEITKLAMQMRQIKRALSDAYRHNRLDEARLLERDKVQIAQMIAMTKPTPASMPAWLIGR